jgi:uncharacterized protein (TIGR02118 family)
MIKVSVFYPNNEGSRFDMRYYCDRHIPMVRAKLGTACKGAEVDRGLGGEVPGSRPSFIAMAHLYFDSVEDFQASFGPHADEIMRDVPNYTSIEPFFQISEVALSLEPAAARSKA